MILRLKCAFFGLGSSHAAQMSGLGRTAPTLSPCRMAPSSAGKLRLCIAMYLACRETSRVSAAARLSAAVPSPGMLRIWTLYTVAQPGRAESEQGLGGGSPTLNFGQMPVGASRTYGIGHCVGGVAPPTYPGLSVAECEGRVSLSPESSGMGGFAWAGAGFAWLWSCRTRVVSQPVCVRVLRLVVAPC